LVRCLRLPIGDIKSLSADGRAFSRAAVRRWRRPSGMLDRTNRHKVLCEALARSYRASVRDWSSRLAIGA
jgi:hypothetical protein